MRISIITALAGILLVSGCGSDDGTATTPTDAPEAGSGLTAVAEATATCLQGEGFTETIAAEIFVVETDEAIDPADGYSVLAIGGDGRDVQVMIFADAAQAEEYTDAAASDGDSIVREPVADGRVVVESGFRAENGEDLEEPADQATLDLIETCVVDAGL